MQSKIDELIRRRADRHAQAVMDAVCEDAAVDTQAQLHAHTADQVAEALRAYTRDLRRAGLLPAEVRA